jgi:hypothetical protein
MFKMSVHTYLYIIILYIRYIIIYIYIESIVAGVAFQLIGTYKHGYSHSAQTEPLWIDDHLWSHGYLLGASHLETGL